MFKLQKRPASAVVTLAAVLLILVQPAAASAQVGDVTDAPFSFKNASIRELTLELHSVVKRNGEKVTFKNVIWKAKPGQYSWLMVNNKKVTGVVCSFVVRTPTIRPLGFEQVSGWNWISGGTTKHGDVCIHFGQDWLQAHLKQPTTDPLKKPRFTPTFSSAADRHRQFLQHQKKRLQAEITREENAIKALGVSGDMLRIIGNRADELGRQSGRADDEMAGFLLKLLGNGLNSAARRDIAAAQSRIQAYRQLIQRYERELIRKIPPV